MPLLQSSGVICSMTFVTSLPTIATELLGDLQHRKLQRYTPR